jgi:hypothetical protein
LLSCGINNLLSTRRRGIGRRQRRGHGGARRNGRIGIIEDEYQAMAHLRTAATTRAVSADISIKRQCGAAADPYLSGLRHGALAPAALR